MTALDIKWIEEFEKIDKQYETFYSEDVNYISIHSIYINDNKIVQTIKEEKLFMREPNYISREELLEILKRNCFHNNKRYTVMSILKYNLELEPADVEYFLKTNYSPSYLSLIKNIDAIPLKKTISNFQDLNCIFILFYENETKKSTNYTKKIFLSNHNNNNNHKKTLKKLA